MDNATFHKNALILQEIMNAGHIIEFLPPYSPDLNPIEKYWANMKKKVRDFLRETQTFIEALDRVIVSM